MKISRRFHMITSLRFFVGAGINRRCINVVDLALPTIEQFRRISYRLIANPCWTPGPTSSNWFARLPSFWRVQDEPVFQDGLEKSGVTNGNNKFK